MMISWRLCTAWIRISIICKYKFFLSLLSPHNSPNIFKSKCETAGLVTLTETMKPLRILTPISCCSWIDFMTVPRSRKLFWFIDWIICLVQWAIALINWSLDQSIIHINSKYVRKSSRKLAITRSKFNWLIACTIILVHLIHFFHLVVMAKLWLPLLRTISERNMPKVNVVNWLFLVWKPLDCTSIKLVY